MSERTCITEVSQINSAGKLVFRAAKEGSVEVLRKLLALPGASHACTFKSSGDDHSPLSIAAVNKHLTCVKALIPLVPPDELAKQITKAESELKDKKMLEELKVYKAELQQFGTTRAHMEREAAMIADRTTCTVGDLQRFTLLMEHLTLECGYTVDRDDDVTPLLIRATLSGNIVIAIKLVEDFKASIYTTTYGTGTPLHIACQLMSPLRFYYVSKCPTLLAVPDQAACLPFHIACQKNDIEFVSWLFHSIITQAKKYAHRDSLVLPLQHNVRRVESLPQMPRGKADRFLGSPVHTPVFHCGTLGEGEGQLECEDKGLEVCTESFNKSLCLSEQMSSYISCPEEPCRDDVIAEVDVYKFTTSVPSLLKIAEDKLLAITVQGHSVFHIAVLNNYVELLSTLLTVAGFMRHSLDLKLDPKVVFVVGDETPVVMAIKMKHRECLGLLLDFLKDADLLKMVAADDRLLRMAVGTGDVETVKLLVRFGINKGLEEAISVAAGNGYEDVLRLLLYHHTQLTNMRNYRTLQSDRKMQRLVGEINWSRLLLTEVQPVWVDDSTSAVESMYSVMSTWSVGGKDPMGAQGVVLELALGCLRYFGESAVAAARRNSSSLHLGLVAITSVEISKSGLRSVPPELFQMPHLSTLTLAQNSISELPSAFSSSREVVYTCRSLKKLVLDGNQLSTLPEDLFLGLVCTLEELSVQRNRLTDLPPGLWVMPHLKTLRLSGNLLSRLHYFSGASETYFRELEGGVPITQCIAQLKLFYQTLCKAYKLDDNFEELVKQVRQQRAALAAQLDLAITQRTRVAMPPPGYHEVDRDEDSRDTSQLQLLDLSSNMFSQLPLDLVCLAPRLNRLDLKYNQISRVDLVRSLPRLIGTANLDHNLIVNTVASRPAYIPCSSPNMMLVPQAQEGRLYCGHASHTVLGKLTTLGLSCNKIEEFVLCEEVEYCLSGAQSTPPANAPPVTSRLTFPALSILTLDQNKLKAVPKEIHRLNMLGSLDLSYNVAIQELPLEMGHLDPQTLCVLRLQGLNISTLPASLLEKSSPRPLLTYLKSKLQSSKPYRRIKLMLMGSVRAGKTTLLQQLTKRGHVDRRKEVEMGVSGVPLSTVGVDLGDWVYRPQKGSPKVTFMTWDFGGQEEYYATHQCFLSERSLYLVVWDVTEGEKGLEGIKPWLENIEARAPGAPVIVVGTHVDCIKQEEKKYLENMFERLYIKYDSSQLAYPSIEPCCQFINCFCCLKMNSLRDFIYDKAINYKKPGSRHCTPLVDETAPQFYISLECLVRDLANKYIKQKKIPVLSREDYCAAVLPLLETREGFDEATSFLHDNGILLHYEDSQLSDLYFIDPQWLCSMLAKVITIQEKNPYQKNGLMLVQDLDKIFTDSTTKPFIKDLVKIMQKFEVVLLLDEQHLLIPSLLPLTQELSCSVFIKDNSPRGEPHLSTSSPSNIPPVPIPSASSPSSPSSSFPSTLIRYQFLHFIPNGFFSRLIARVVSGPILRQCGEWLSWPWPIEEGMSLEGPHWCCWRSGVKLVWNNVEILRIVPVDCPLPGHKYHRIISSRGDEKIELSKGVKIKVDVLPEECILPSYATSVFSSDDVTSRHICVATWLLQKGVECVRSVLDDWYEVFGRKRGIEYSTVTIASPCPACVRPSGKEDSITGSIKEVAYFFSSPYCARMVAEGRDLECPLHGKMSVADIAPDMVFRDFVPSMVFDSKCIIKSHTLGEGGFGAVFAGTTSRHGSVAVKEYASQGVMEENTSLQAELTAWEIYQNAGQEARVMYRLNHQNILQLLGVTLAPLRLLLELAPLGDLKACVQKFQQAKVKISRATLQSTMIQVAEALNYLHNQSFIFRDIKPGNVLVWKFPLPETQWTGDQVVQLKLADYGICKQFTPQGERGVQGTKPYLPPEVLLHGGQEAYSTKLDVYSFGMFMYYLFSFGNPFEKEMRPPEALLSAGKRPELLLRQRPNSLWMIELMCWCWSEKPQHRPTFLEILRVLRTSVLTSLMSAVELNEQGITVACYKLSSSVPSSSPSPITSPRSSVTSPSPITSPRTSVTSSPLLLSGEQETNSATYPVIGLSENSILEVWYGGADCLSVVAYHPKGVGVEVIDKSGLKIVSSICITGDQVWVATVGTGLHIYSATTKKEVARWEGSSKIFKLVFIEHTSCMLALAHKGTHLFAVSEIPQQAVGGAVGGAGFLKAVPKHSSALKEDLSDAVIAGCCHNVELWAVCSSAVGTQIAVLDCLGTLQAEICDQVRTGRRIKYLASCTGTNHVLISDRHYLELWEVQEKRMAMDFDCSEVCKQTYGSPDYSNYVSKKSADCIHRLSRITSLLCFNEAIYVGTGGGMILVMSTDLRLLTSYHTCAGASRCLMGIRSVKQVKSHSRFFSRKEEVLSSSETMERSSTPSEVTSSGSSSDMSIVVSFGGTYFGATNYSTNVPPSLKPPGDPPSCTTSPYPYLITKPTKDDVVLIWSAYNPPMCGNDDDGGDQLENE